MRILLASLLTLAALVAATPSGTAVAICSTQTDASDQILGDDPLARESCTTENLISYDCDAAVTVHYDGSVVRTTRCDPLIQCVTDPCPGPATQAAALPCATVGSPVLDGGFGVQCSYGALECSAVTATFGTLEAFLSPDAGCTYSTGGCEIGPNVEDGRVDRIAVECGPFIQCVTEPCPGSGGIKI